MKRPWSVERRTGYPGWWVTHEPTGDTFAASSKREAKDLIGNGWYERQVAKDLAVKPAGRRDWHHDPLTGEDHLYTGGLFSWHCDVHERTCDPFYPVTTDHILTWVANDTTLDDDTFATLRQFIAPDRTDEMEA